MRRPLTGITIVNGTDDTGRQSHWKMKINCRKIFITVYRQRAVIVTSDDENRLNKEKIKKKSFQAKTHEFGEDAKSVAGAWAARGLRTRVVLDG